MVVTQLEQPETRSRASSIVSRQSDLRTQVCGEFTEMPGLTLTLAQAARLWAVTPEQSERVLSDLVASGFLMRDVRGAYRRRGCPRCS